MRLDPFTAAILLFVIPLLVVIAVLGSERLTAPNLAEHHDRRRTPGRRRDAVERYAAIAFALVVAVLFILGFVDLWVNKSPF